MEIFQALSRVVPAPRVMAHEPMSLHTTMRVGGSADCFVLLETEEELTGAVALCIAQEIPFVVMGRGSNFLVSDNGFRGAVLCTASGLQGIEEEGEHGLRAGSGVGLSALAAFALERGCTGLEFVAGIPGTVGGGIRMNAGAYGGELSGVVTRVRLLTPSTGRVTEVTTASGALDFGYRHSALMETGQIVLSAAFSLEEGEREAIRAQMALLAAKRREKQPLEYASAGSTWKRPEGDFAARLIEEAGCKGLSVGDAQISEKHAGFLINRGHASAGEIRALMELVERRVYETSGIKLKPEIEFLGEF